MHDYVDLSTVSRIKILKVLADMALSTDVIREHVNSLVEAFWAQRNKNAKSEGMEAAQQEGPANSTGTTSPVPDGVYDASEKWMKWMASCK